MNSMKYIGAYIHDEDFEALDKWGRDNQMSRSEMIRRALTLMTGVTFTVQPPGNPRGRTPKYGPVIFKRWVELEDEGWSQIEIANSYGVSQSYVSKKIRERREDNI